MTALAAWSFIRAYWKLGVLALLLLALGVQTLRLGAANNRADRIRINLNEARAELKAISTKKAEQRAETEGNVKKAETGNWEADKVAERIEKAPPTLNCATPPEIMGADL